MPAPVGVGAVELPRQVARLEVDVGVAERQQSARPRQQVGKRIGRELLLVGTDDRLGEDVDRHQQQAPSADLAGDLLGLALGLPPCGWRTTRLTGRPTVSRATDGVGDLIDGLPLAVEPDCVTFLLLRPRLFDVTCHREPEVLLAADDVKVCGVVVEAVSVQVTNDLV